MDHNGQDLSTRLRGLTDNCNSISLLVIGPWTSFLRYAPDILERVKRIVVQGRPYPDELGGEPIGFNCTFDLDSCYAAFDLLAGRQKRSGSRFRATWVNTPAGPKSCAAAEPGVDAEGNAYTPSARSQRGLMKLERAADQADGRTPGLNRGSVAREVAKLLRSNPASLAQTSLWDDLAALYLMRPDLSAVRGG